LSQHGSSQSMNQSAKAFVKSPLFKFPSIQFKNNPFFWTWLICTLLFFLRGWDRFIYAVLWAEDGTYISQVLQDPLGTLFYPLGAYFQITQRLLAWLIVHSVSAEAIPSAVTAVSYAFSAFVLATISRKQYRWLIPSDSMRILLAAALCFAPGLQDAAGHLNNLYTFCFFEILQGNSKQKYRNKEY